MNSLKKQLTFGDTLKLIRIQKNLTIRNFSEITGISPAYICDLEKGYRKGNLNTVMKISEKLILSGDENKMLMYSFYREHLSLPEELIYYLIDNDLLDSIKIIKENDKNGERIKTLALNLKQKKN